MRSVSKSLDPDLRLAVVAGDAATVAQVQARQSVGMGWVSHVLQELVADLLSERRTLALLRQAAEAYGPRRRALLAALARHGILAHGRSGLNVWVPVPGESEVVRALAAAG